MSAIDLRGVSKQYGDVTALQELTLTVDDGEVFGFLGPNGAGKSTTIDILLDHARPDTGQVRVLGMDAQDSTVAVREQTGVLPESFGPLGQMTGRQHLSFTIEAKGATDDPDELLARVGLDDAGDRPASAYSKGMSQRLMLAMALAGSPELLILDEPTTGLDPNGARQMREIITAERERGATVFFSSHILEQVEAVCDRVGILAGGSIVTVDTIDGLRDAAGTTGEIVITLEHVPENLVAHIEDIERISSVTVSDSTLRVGCANRAKGDVVRACLAVDPAVTNIETSKASLEDLFATYTGGR